MAGHVLSLYNQEMLWDGNPGTNDCAVSKIDSSWDLFQNRELLSLLDTDQGSCPSPIHRN